MSQAAASRSFKLDLRREMRGILEDEYPKFLEGVAIDTAVGIVRRNPVLTGLSAGNWHATSYPSEQVFPERKDPQKSTTIQRLIADIRAMAGTVSQMHIQNNQPYINKLEDGFSRKAPAGMVAITLREIEARHGL